LASLASSPVVASSLALRLWCLGIKGDVDGEMDSASARADWDDAHRVAAQMNDKKWESRSVAEAGFSAYLQGDIATGRRNIAAGLGAAHKTGDVGAEVRYLSAIGTGLEWNGSVKEALDYFQKASLLAKQNPEIGYPFLTVAGEIQTLIREHKYDEAEQLVRTSSAHAIEHEKRIKLTQLMLFDADIALGQKQPDRAIGILQKTILLAQGNQARMLADAEMKLAEIYREQRRLALAEHYAAAAFAHTHLSNDVFTAPARLELTAQLQWDLGRRSQARRSVMRALEISEGLLAQTSSGAVREGLLTEMSSAYETAFAFAAESGDVNAAFSVIERVRGRITAETLVQPPRASAQPANMALEDQIRNLKIQLIKAPSPAERGRLIEGLFYAEQQRYVEDKPAPVYVSKIESVRLKSVVANLDKDEAILEYVLPENGNGYCLLLSQSETKIIPLGPANAITASAQEFLNIVKENKPWEQPSRAAYAAILEPIPNINHFKHLIIVPDGILHLIPFDALVAPSGKVVGDTSVTTFAPSAVSDFILKRRNEVRTSNTFLGIGGAIYDQTGAKPFTLAKANARGPHADIDFSKLSNLPGSLEEVQSAAAILKGTDINATLQIGPEATEFAFTHAPLPSYQVIHLAIHAIANQDDPSRAALIFPPDPQHGSDGLLGPSDIANLRFGARVVVLSACSTAVGRLQGQVGVANLARAFLQAGADSVVSTLWPIDDVHTLFLMKAFYRHFAAGDAASTALASAKRDMLRESGRNASPLSWAGFILIGNGDATLQNSQAPSVHPIQ
ncbi:MAG: CHAT domain-containing protein, partial [Acidobacteriota bacterium]|nr:CHAT domain-containing protein [Acidobacteriota bacterium]